MKSYQIELQGKSYTIKLKSFGRIDINGTVYTLRSLPHRHIAFIPMEYDLPVPEGKVMRVSGMFTMQLVVDGINQSNGKPHTPISKVPAWAYIFAILDFAMCLGGGAIPVLLAVVSFYLTLRVSASELYPLGVRLLLSVVILAGGWLLLFLLALAVSAICPRLT